MTIVPKSGWPVLGQTAVNSGQVISISYSRSGNWFGNVSTAEGMANPRDQGNPPIDVAIRAGTGSGPHFAIYHCIRNRRGFETPRHRPSARMGRIGRVRGRAAAIENHPVKGLSGRG